ncbi:hypothetical protein [Coleofasciculus sp.]|uniref:hypothetical protein n=1 Tax=Coleofasciculus sp. TaxID=3100458 RepID=UPI003A407B0A
MLRFFCTEGGASKPLQIKKDIPLPSPGRRGVGRGSGRGLGRGQASNPLSDRRLIGVKGQQQTLLIVDDNAINRSLLGELLKPFDLNIFKAVDGQDC